MTIFKKNIIFSAFTLAEILIVIGIIGIICELTIPTMVSDFQKQTTVAKLKETYSILSQSILNAEAAYGTTDSWEWASNGETGLSLTKYFANTYFYPYIKADKKCENKSKDCWTPTISLDRTACPYLASSDGQSLSAILTNGTSIYFWAAAGTYEPHARFFVDIDGPDKGKNQLGKDVFSFALHLSTKTENRKGLFPEGTGSLPLPSRTALMNNSTGGCNKSSTGVYAGWFCSGIIAIDGWKISEDYPW